MVSRLDHYGRDALSLIKENFERPAQLVRISTGYFNFQGWDLLRHFLQCEEVRILIGFDQDAPEMIRDKIADLIMADLRKWHDKDRRAAIEQIVASIEANRFYLVKHEDVEELHLRTRQKDHTKVYILDSEIVLAGSVNLSYSGLRTNRENLTGVTEENRKWIYINGFETSWTSDSAIDITPELLAKLKRWLEMADPFDIYLKTISMFTSPVETGHVKASYKRPNEYQIDVINQMERQLEQYNGCILIASTGLGKTVMATDTALRLYTKDLINNVIVFAPVPTHDDWERTLGSSGIRPQVFTRNLLDVPTDNALGKLDKMLLALEEVDEKTLIIVDEAQYLANKNRQPRRTKQKKFIKGEREAYKRLREAVRENKAFIILMTATPFVKRASDINNQLSLLPATGTEYSKNKRGQLRMLLDTTEDVSTDWHIAETEFFFEDFVNLPVSTIITTAYVGKHYCTLTDEGEYLDFPDKRRYLPQVSHYIVRVPLVFEQEIDEIIKGKILEHQTFHFRDRDFQRRSSRYTIEQRSTIAWTSSPLALQQSLEKVISGKLDENIPFTRSLEVRQKKLLPTINQLKRHKAKDDPKFGALLTVLDKSIENGQKVIIFVETLPTAYYLEKNILHARKSWRISSTVSYDKNENEFKTKPKREAQRILNHFAPIANADKIHRSVTVEHSNILITTDAFGAGINLQDASVVINYDLAWTPDAIIQRAGRVMRFWDEPRQVNVYTFMPAWKSEVMGNALHQAMKRIAELMRRQGSAVKFSEYFFLLEDEKSFGSFGDLSQIEIENRGMITPDNIEHLQQVSPMLDRRAELRKYSEYAKTLPDDLISAMEKSRITRPHLYMLIRALDRPVLILYDLEQKKLIKERDDHILDFIHCVKEEPRALVDSQIVEEYAQECIILWCVDRGVDADSVERICTMLIVPKRDSRNDPFYLKSDG